MHRVRDCIQGQAPADLDGVVAESRKRIALGPCIDATVLGREQYQRGQVGAGISIDWYDLTQWTVR